jgi:hypothetical protein
MAYDQNMLRALYKRLIAFYPRGFKEQLGESMEQTFNDLCNEKRQTKKELFSFILWTFTETAVGIFREHLLLIYTGDIMQTTLKTIGSPALVSLLLIFPFMIIEVVNRRNFNEDFPFMLFFGLWLSLFAITLILLPIVRARWMENHDMANSVPAKGDTLLVTTKSVLITSLVIILFLAIVPLLNSPNSEVFRIQVPSQFIAFTFLSLPIVLGMIAAKPIVKTLRTGGSLFAHPIHLIIVVVISFLFAMGFVSLILDQWPCFVGVPNCD